MASVGGSISQIVQFGEIRLIDADGNPVQ